MTTSKNPITYLEFGSLDIEQGEKHVYDFRTHDQAYEWLMMARYANDMMAYDTMVDCIRENRLDFAISEYQSEVHHQNDSSVNLGKLIALLGACNSQKTGSFFEFGQTLFGCIEAIRFLQFLGSSIGVDSHLLDLSKVDWYGVDISKNFNKLAVLLHQKYQATTFDSLSKMMQRTDVFFAKGITLLYACETLEELLKIIFTADLGIFDCSFSLDNSQRTSIGTGRMVTYLPFHKFYEMVKKEGREVYVKEGNSRFDKRNNRVWLDCLVGNNEDCVDFMNRDIDVRNQFNQKLEPKAAEIFLNNDLKPRWINALKFVTEIE